MNEHSEHHTQKATGKTIDNPFDVVPCALFSHNSVHTRSQPYLVNAIPPHGRSAAHNANASLEIIDSFALARQFTRVARFILTFPRAFLAPSRCDGWGLPPPSPTARRYVFLTSTRRTQPGARLPASPRKSRVRFSTSEVPCATEKRYCIRLVAFLERCFTNGHVVRKGFALHIAPFLRLVVLRSHPTRRHCWLRCMCSCQAEIFQLISVDLESHSNQTDVHSLLAVARSLLACVGRLEHSWNHSHGRKRVAVIRWQVNILHTLTPASLIEARAEDRCLSAVSDGKGNLSLPVMVATVEGCISLVPFSLSMLYLIFFPDIQFLIKAKDRKSN